MPAKGELGVHYRRGRNLSGGALDSGQVAGRNKWVWGGAAALLGDTLQGHITHTPKLLLGLSLDLSQQFYQMSQKCMFVKH